MTPQEFKSLFAEVAKRHHLESAHGRFVKESPDCILVIELQKSKYGKYFDVNLKVFVRGLFGRSPARTKEMLEKLPGDVFLRTPQLYQPAMNLETPINVEERRLLLERLFRDFIESITQDALTRKGLISLADRGVLHILPVVRRELDLSN